jgi:hypothetical protein
MKLERLLYRLEAEASAKADLQWKQDRLDLVKRRTAKQPTVTQSCRQQVRDLRSQSEDIYEEIYQRKLLQIAQEQLTRANMALMQARQTPQERKEMEEETLRGRILFSKVIPELSPSWREEATLAFKNKKL